MEQNKSIKKFIRKVKKDYNLYAAKLDKKLFLARDAKIIESFKNGDVLSRSKIFTDDVVDSMTCVILEEEAEMVDLCTELKDIIEKIESKKAFPDFILLEKYLNKYYFTEEEKLEVFVYLLRQNIEFVAEIENQFLADLDNKDNTESNVAGLDKTKNRLEVKDVFEAFAGLNEFISSTGEFLPNIDYEKFLGLIERTYLKMSGRQALLLIKNCTHSFFDTINEVDNKAHEEEFLTKEVSHENNKPNYAERKKLYDEKRKAIELIKSYFKDDQVIAFVSEEALEKIINALHLLGYSEKRIESIKLAIKEYNARYTEKIQNKEFFGAKQLYLTSEENKLLSEVEELLFNEDHVTNSLFNSLIDNYSLLKELLLKLYNFNENDYTEPDELNNITDLTDITLEDLKAVYEAYKLSDYRVLRALKKKEN